MKNASTTGANYALQVESVNLGIKVLKLREIQPPLKKALECSVLVGEYEIDLRKKIEVKALSMDKMTHRSKRCV